MTSPTELISHDTADNRSPEDIMRTAHAAAGGESWVHPISLTMEGYAVFYGGAVPRIHERHVMYRVYPETKTDAHVADGKVRITSIAESSPVFDIAFDGAVTSTNQGIRPKSSADARWASNFGFGVIRHALDEGYQLKRQPDDLVDNRATYTIDVIDAAGGTTRFWIAQDNAAILKVGFNTERGWHTRIYSNFFSNPGVDWVQPGRVRLYYDDVKANEVIWQSFSINDDLPDCLFRLPEACLDN